MHNKVVYHAMKAFSSVGLPVVRFNFRGTGLSEGTHDEGRGERDDVLAVLDWMETESEAADSVCGILVWVQRWAARLLWRCAGEGADRTGSAGAGGGA